MRRLIILSSVVLAVVVGCEGRSEPTAPFIPDPGQPDSARTVIPSASVMLRSTPRPVF